MDEPSSRRFAIGYALAAKKQRSFVQDSLVSTARSRGIDLVPIDIDRPLVEQGPFDCVIHKLSGEDWKFQLSEYSSRYPDVPIVDPPELIERLHSRISMLEVVNEVEVAQGEETFGIPKQVVVYDQESFSDSGGALSKLKFPMIAKPMVADGSAKSHKMSLVYHREGLLKLKPPIVLQEFVNHGGVIFKVYVVGDYVNCVKRNSLPDVPDEKLECYEGSVPFSQVSNTPMAMQHPTEEKYCEKMDLENAEMPPMSFIRDIARALGRTMGLRLFNFDVIRDAKIGNHYLVIDINYFPGYAKMPQYESALTDFFWGIVHKGTVSGVLKSDEKETLNLVAEDVLH